MAETQTTAPPIIPPPTLKVGTQQDAPQPVVMWVTRWVCKTGESGLVYWNPLLVRR